VRVCFNLEWEIMKNYQKILSVLALLSMCLAAPAFAESTDDAIKRLEEQIAAQQAQIDALKKASTVTALSLQDTQKDIKDTIEGSLSGYAKGNVSIGATFFGDYAAFPNGGYGRPFETDVLPPPGTSDYNTFAVTRAYINLKYTPNEHVMLRITPDIHYDGSSKDFRLKYGYLEFQKIFPQDSFMSPSKVVFGQQQQPLFDFVEHLNDHRYVYTSPLDYVGILSSSYLGASLKGPIKFGGKEYLDYHIGVFNIASYSGGVENNDQKQGMGRLTIYPFGSKGHQEGFGITMFDAYGYTGVSTPGGNGAKAKNSGTAMIHYVSPSGKYRAGFAYEFGRNSVTGTSLIGGGTSIPAYNTVATTFVPSATSGGTWYSGYDAFGQAPIGNSPFSVFGIWQLIQPNTNFGSNPLDVQRIIGGLEYKVNKQVRIAATSQNLLHTNSSQLNTAVLNAGGSASDAAAATQDINAAVISLLYDY